jgi:uncharacterized DUF497 family protein
MVVVKLPSVLSFEWDKGNEQKNWIKHKVTEEEAEEPFFTDDYLILEDESHSSKQEERYILLGKTNQEKMLFIVFTIRGERIRIISARDADKKEVLFYEKVISLAEV